MICDQTVQGPHAPSGGAFRRKGAFRGNGGHASDIQMRPRHIFFHKPLQKLPSRDRARRPRAHIFHISNARFEHFVIGRRQGHTPSAFAFGRGRRDEIL